MKKKWASAIGSIRSFEKMFEVTVASSVGTQELPDQQLDATQSVLLSDIDKSSCRLWNAVQVTNNPPMNAANSTAFPNPHSHTTIEEHNLGLPALPDSSLDRGNLVENVILEGEADWEAMFFEDQPEGWQFNEHLFGGYLFWDELPADV
jgi:hypothetical protein